MLDSKAAIKVMSSSVISSKMVWECLSILNELGRNNIVILLWVPGYTGVWGNEIAELAKNGAQTTFWGPETFCGISTYAILAEMEKKKHGKD